MENSEAIVIEHTYNAPAAKVWKAITDKAEMKQWYFDVSDFKPEVGFEFTFEGKNEDRVFVHLCKVVEVVPGKKLTYSWRYQGVAGNSFVTFELFDEGATTRLRLTHEGIETFPADTGDYARGNFVMGWTHIIAIALTEFVEKA